ncbi:MAG: hybrid sensor histidine kinase/response regulator [bacterium]|nr:hybrid sensor histidine kinase/response regulator [bacterium]
MSQPPILIVDDNPQNIQLAAQALASQGHPLAFAQSGIEALQQVERIQPDLILLDVMMPGMDGYEVCRQLKAKAQTADIPVIFLTAKSDEESLALGFAAGAVDYVSKPFNTGEIQARVNTHLKLRVALRQLKEANAAKDRFFSIISHDLKGPFNGLVGISDLLVDEFDQLPKEEMLPLIEGINHSSKTGYRLLIQLLEWARAQTGRIAFEPSSLGLAPLVQEVVDLLNEQAKAKEITWALDIPAEATVFADAQMLHTVLRNLLSNALKFSHRQSQISIGAEAVEMGWQVSVKDQGVGMKPEVLAKLFKLDQQVTTPGTQGEEGTGLGLLMVQEFLSRHDQPIWVESTPGQGTQFYFTLAPAPTD